MLIDWFTVSAQAVNFLLLVWLLKRFLYKPVLAAIDQREKRIATQIQDAEKKKAEAAQEQTDFLHKNEDFEKQRAGLLLEASKTAKAERDRLLEKARTDSEDLRSKLKKTAHDELDNLNGKIGTLAVQEVFSIARKTLAELADVNLDERMTAIFLRRLHDLNDQQREDLKAALATSGRPALVRTAFEVGPPQKTAIEAGIKAILGEGTAIEYETKIGLISGIELTANGQKFAWSIADYLTTLTNSVHGLLEPKFEPAPVAQKAMSHAA
jgi:F-type H+-transporting ATPase subunit b